MHTTNKQIGRHLMLRRPSVVAIHRLCQECLDHDQTWHDFKSRVEETLKRESKVIAMLEDKMGKHLDR